MPDKKKNNGETEENKDTESGNKGGMSETAETSEDDSAAQDTEE